MMTCRTYGTLYDVSVWYCTHQAPVLALYGRNKLVLSALTVIWCGQMIVMGLALRNPIRASFNSFLRIFTIHLTRVFTAVQLPIGVDG